MTSIARSDDEPPGAGRALRLRALRADVTPRFVAVGDAGPYELVHEDGEAVGAGGVVLVAYPDASAWEPFRALLAPRQGYLGSRLYRAEDGDVALVRWSSPLMYARALREPEIGAAAEGLDAALYLPL